MALFQFRKGRDEQAAKLAPAPTIEAVRRRAMHRLIGAAVLVLAGVIGFPLVFDNQPRPIPVDLPIEIADKTKVKPLTVPAPAPAAAASAASPATVSKPATPAPAAAVAKPVATPETVAAATPAPTTPPAAVAKPPAAATDTPPAKPAEASKAQALLEGKEAPAAAGSSRFVVQVGAFADDDKMKEVRKKVEGAGLKTLIQVVQTKDGNRTRVRVGPFTDKEEAQKVADRIRKLDLSPVILTL